MKYRFAQSALVTTLSMSLALGMVTNVVIYDFAHAQQTGGSGNGNSSNTNGNSGNSNGNGSSTSSGNQGNGNTEGNQGNGPGGGNQGNGNGNGGNQGNGNGNGGNKSSGDNSGSDDSYYDGERGKSRSRGNAERSDTRGKPIAESEEGPTTESRLAPFEKTLARLFSAPGRAVEPAAEPSRATPQRTVSIRRPAPSKLKETGKAPATVSMRPPSVVERASDGVITASAGGSFGSFENGAATSVDPNSANGRAQSIEAPGIQTAGLVGAAYEEADLAENAPATAPAIASALAPGQAPETSRGAEQRADAAQGNAAPENGRPNNGVASVSMRPATKGVVLSGARSSLASALKSLASLQANANGLANAAPGSVPGMLNIYREAALVEVEKKAAFELASSVTSVAAERAMNAEHGVLKAIEAVEAAEGESKLFAEKDLRQARAEMNSAAMVLQEAKRAEVQAAMELETAQVVKYKAFVAMPGAKDLPLAARDELNELLGIQELASARANTGKSGVFGVFDDDA